MKNLTNSILIKSNWFDENGKYKSIGFNGYYLYLKLFRFLINDETDGYTFYTSVEVIRKVIGMENKAVLELLKLLVKYKIIKINITRWDRMLDANGKVLDNKLLIIESIDHPNVPNDDSEIDEENYYIVVDLKLMDQYLTSGLDKRSLVIFCLMSKYSNNAEGKSWLTIQAMSNILGIGKSKLTDVIRNMNKQGFLYSKKNKNTKQIAKRNGDGYEMKWDNYEYKILTSWKNRDEWLKIYGDQINKNLKEWKMK